MTIEDETVRLWQEFCQAEDIMDVLEAFHRLCKGLNIEAGNSRRTYLLIKSKIDLIDKRARKLWTALDKRAGQEEYAQGKICQGHKVLVIGTGPCGLRMAIESALLGAKTVSVEMRKYISRNNVLHLWQFVIQDLKLLGIKYFYPRFCVGALDHISIRRLQLCLLKISLVVGVEVHCPVAFKSLQEPDPAKGTGWKIITEPPESPAANYNYDVIIGADGKRNTLPGYTMVPMRGKLALGITTNFVNHNTREDSRIQEIGGLAYVFDQEFFNFLKDETGVSLENFVYFKDETHYFVMTPKKESLLQLGVLRRDYPGDSASLLSRENVDYEKMESFVRHMAITATRGQLQNPQFAINHRNEKDMAIFDFTAMHQAQHSCLAVQKHGQKLLTCIVGDTLINPFWPTGSGCARGFLGVFDAAWLMRNWCAAEQSELELIAEREDVFKLLSQTKPNTIRQAFSKYTIDPKTRYSNIQHLLRPHQVASLFKNDDSGQKPMPRPRESVVSPTLPDVSGDRARKRLRGGSLDTNHLLMWYKDQLSSFSSVSIVDLYASWKDGRALCAILQKFRPGLVDVKDCNASNPQENIQKAFDLIEQEFGVSPMMKASELAFAAPNKLAMLSYLAQLQEVLQEEIPLKMPRLADGDTFQLGRSTLERTNASSVLLKLSMSMSKKPVEKSQHGASAMGGGNYESVSTFVIGMMKTKKAKEQAELKNTLNPRRSGKKQLVGRASYENVKHQSVAQKKNDDHKLPQSLLQEKENYVQKKPKQGLSRKAAIKRTSRMDTEEVPKKSDALPSFAGGKREEKPAMDERYQSLARQACQGVALQRIKAFQEGKTDQEKAKRAMRESIKALHGQSRVSGLSKKNSREPSKDPNVQSSGRVLKRLEQATSDEQKLKEKRKSSSDICCVCGKELLISNRLTSHGYFFHRDCFRCSTASCRVFLRAHNVIVHRDEQGNPNFYCLYHGFHGNNERQHSYQEKESEKPVEKQAALDSVTEEDTVDSPRSSEEDFKENALNSTLDSCIGALAKQYENEGQETPDGGKDSANGSSEEEEEDSDDETEEEEEEEEEEEAGDGDKGPLSPLVGAVGGPSLTRMKTLTRSTLPRSTAALKQSISIRLLEADEIQSGFDTLEYQTRKLEKEALRVEETIRKNNDAASDELLNEWLDIQQEQQDLKNREAELMLKVKLMELQEHHVKLQVQMNMLSLADESDKETFDKDLACLENETEELEKEMNIILQQMSDMKLHIEKKGESIA